MLPAAVRLKRDIQGSLLTDEPELIRTAIQRLGEARRAIAMCPSTLANILTSMSEQLWTLTLPSMAVTVSAEGQKFWVINPSFLLELDDDGVVFGTCHEALHVLFRHLWPDLQNSRDPVFVNAMECVINYKVMQITGLSLPMVKGKPYGIDPKVVYRQYAADLGPKALSIEELYATDIGCYHELLKMKAAPKPSKKGNLCVRAEPGKGDPTAGKAGAGESDAGDQAAPDPAALDPAATEQVAQQVVEAAVQAARAGTRGAKEELFILADTTPDNPMWGTAGVGALRGQTSAIATTDHWEYWTRDAIASRLDAGFRLRYNRKLTFDRRITPHGPVERRHGSVFVDASGSMAQEVLDKVAAIIGDDPELLVEWHSFDGAVWPFKAGEPFQGGGGTSFAIIEDHVLSEDEATACCEDPDFILVITDGHAPHIAPGDEERWIWLITEGGDAWPDEDGMSCRTLEL